MDEPVFAGKILRMFIPGYPIPGFPLLRPKRISRNGLPGMGGAEAHFFGNGREALFAGLSLLKSKGLERLWLPAYLCRSVEPAISGLRLSREFYDVDEDL